MSQNPDPFAIPAHLLGEPSGCNYAAAVQDLCSMFPRGTWLNSLCGTVNSGTTVEMPTLDQIIAMAEAFKQVQRENDDNLAAALGEFVRRSRYAADYWAGVLGLPVQDLVAIIDGDRRPVPGWFWDRIRDVFDPGRPRGA